MGRRLDEEAWSERPDGDSYEIHDALSSHIWRQGNHRQYRRKRHQEFAHLSPVEFGQFANLLHRFGISHFLLTIQIIGIGD